MSVIRRYSYLNNVDFVEELYQKYVQDPHSVDASWKYFFDGLDLGETISRAPTNGHRNGLTNGHKNGVNGIAQVESKMNTPKGVDIEAKVTQLINAYRDHGILVADLDPLHPPQKQNQLLNLARFGLSESDLSQSVTAGQLLGLGKSSTLKQILERLQSTYCHTVGVDVTHITRLDIREWLLQKMESTGNREFLNRDTKLAIYQRLVEAESFERFLHTRYVAQKRFSVEGGENLIPALDRIIQTAADLGANNVVMGMAHRGRLNVLTHIFGKKAEYIFTEFEQKYAVDGLATMTENLAAEGDVKYHMGYSADIVTPNGKNVHLSLANNPSHLQFVHPVVEGVARAKQTLLKDREREKVLPIVIHGDAAFAGQGVVYETLNLSEVPGYTTGGTVHVIVNNQVGFTTSPKVARSTPYATDVAKMLDAPVFHVNGDDAEAVWYVARLATEFRYQFKKDVVIDLVCYRKYGHNEGDEPSFTQPLMYQKIKSHPSPREIYERKLVGESVLNPEIAGQTVDRQMAVLTEAQRRTREENPKPLVLAFSDLWKERSQFSEEACFAPVNTMINADLIRELGVKLTNLPSDFQAHPKLKKFFEDRRNSMTKGIGIDWSGGEVLAFASLLLEGHRVRLTGQDVERGTFTHRHSVHFDVNLGGHFIPLCQLSDNQGQYEIYNSTLSETAVLGFEYGWSLVDPNSLVIWEAQFGDFVNGAQVIVDQFIASGESKWKRASGLVMLLPHGYEGQGPEHSSSRLERFLTLSGKFNWFVCNFTTPAQYFHALRRQMKWPFRKPLVVMSPKSLLRHPQAVSSMDDFTTRGFQEVIDDPLFFEASRKKQVKRVILCTGKIYYELVNARVDKKLDDQVAIVRIEQLYPMKPERLADLVQTYPGAELVWVQEEPRNMGAWGYMFNCWHGGYLTIMDHVGGRKLRYVGRERGAASAVGSMKMHVLEQQQILEQAMTL